MNLYPYVFPIFTNLGDYLYSAIGILIPFTIYFILSKYIKTNEDIRKQEKKIMGINFGFITIPVIILLVILIILVSGIWKYQMIAIASNSMTPTFEKGDAVIFEKVGKEDIEEGDIIVFRKGNILVSHRVVNTKEISFKTYYITKGDANKSLDANPVSQDEVLGVVKRVVKYIGYPTVWINELFGGETRENQ